MLLFISTCDTDASDKISFVDIKELRKNAGQLFDIKVKVSVKNASEHNRYDVYLSISKGNAAIQTVEKENVSGYHPEFKDVVEFKEQYFAEECRKDCRLTAELIREDCEERWSDGSCGEDAYAKAATSSIPITLAPNPWTLKLARQSSDQIKVSLTKDGSPAAKAVAKIIACADTGKTMFDWREEDRRMLCNLHNYPSWMPSAMVQASGLHLNAVRQTAPNILAGQAIPAPAIYDVFGNGAEEAIFDNSGSWTGMLRDYVDKKRVCYTKVYIEVDGHAIIEALKDHDSACANVVAE